MSLVRGSAIVAWQTLRAHKLRSILTCVSLAIAVLALATVDSAAQVASSAVVKDARLTQGIPETWELTVPAGDSSWQKVMAALRISNSILTPNGGGAAAVASASGTLDGVPVQILAIKGDFRSIRPLPIISGTWLTPGEATISPEVVVGRVGGGFSIGGATLQFPGFDKQISARIVGRVADSPELPYVYVWIDDVRLWTEMVQADWTITLLGHSSVDRPTEAGRALAQGAALTDISGTPARIDQAGSTEDTLIAVRLTFLVVAMVSMIVGVLGITNIGLASLRERVEEIALRRATGAPAVQVALSVLMESMIASILSGFIAIGLSWLALPWVIQTLFPNLASMADTAFPVKTLALGIAAAGLAGFAGGIIPALRASRLNIADVMRA